MIAKANQCWRSMGSRCYSSCDSSYKNYGGRGISICERWRCNFLAFLSDMGLPPSQRHSIDRIDVNGNYEPGNCRWATRTEQARNTRRSSPALMYKGKSVDPIDWADLFGLDRWVVRCAAKRGETAEDTIANRWKNKGPALGRLRAKKRRLKTAKLSVDDSVECA